MMSTWWQGDPILHGDPPTLQELSQVTSSLLQGFGRVPPCKGSLDPASQGTVNLARKVCTPSKERCIKCQERVTSQGQ